MHWEDVNSTKLPSGKYSWEEADILVTGVQEPKAWKDNFFMQNVMVFCKDRIRSAQVTLLLPEGKEKAFTQDDITKEFKVFAKKEPARADDVYAWEGQKISFMREKPGGKGGGGYRGGGNYQREDPTLKAKSYAFAYAKDLAVGMMACGAWKPKDMAEAADLTFGAADFIFGWLKKPENGGKSESDEKSEQEAD